MYGYEKLQLLWVVEWMMVDDGGDIKPIIKD